jgi:hypothetical protein
MTVIYKIVSIKISNSSVICVVSCTKDFYMRGFEKRYKVFFQIRTRSYNTECEIRVSTGVRLRRLVNGYRHLKIKFCSVSGSSSRRRENFSWTDWPWKWKDYKHSKCVYQLTRCNIPEDLNLLTARNVKKQSLQFEYLKINLFEINAQQVSKCKSGASLLRSAMSGWMLSLLSVCYALQTTSARPAVFRVMLS